MISRSSMRDKLLISIIIIAFLGSFCSHKYRAPKRKYSDFHCFYTAGKRILNQENIYVLRDKETAEFRYAPIFAVLMSGLALMKEDAADTVWYIINFCWLIVSFILLKRLVVSEGLNYRQGLILYTLTILGVFRFILHNFDAGQTNILMLFSIIVGLYYISRKREGWGPAILAFSVMIKYTPLVFIPYFLFKRKFKLGLMVLVFVGIYLFLPALFIGFKTNLLYLKNLIPFLTQSTIFDQMTVLDPKNQSLLSLIHRIFTNCVLYFHAPPMPFHSLNLSTAAINMIFITLSLGIYLVILYEPKEMRLKDNKNLSSNIDYALLLICVILFNLNSWKPNFILLLPAYFILVYSLIKRGFRDKTAFILLCISYLLNVLTMDSLFGKALAYKLYFYSPLTISALITFFLLFKIKFSKNLP